LSQISPMTVSQMQEKLNASVDRPSVETSRRPLVDSVVVELLQLTKLDELAIQDVTRRQEGLIQLIYTSDRKALQLVGIYFALIAATSSAALALHNSSKLNRQDALATFAMLLILFVALSMAFRAQWTAKINITGRKPDFWQWAREHEVPPDDIVREYLKVAAENMERNEAVNTMSSKLLRYAYATGLFVLPYGFIVFACASYFG
jgi:hypothetical protein